MKPRNAFTIVTTIVIFGEATASFLAENGMYLTAIILAGFTALFINQVVKANKDAKQ